MNRDTETRAAATGLSALLPDTAAGYTPAGPDRYFTADTLFELIDGGAEIYRALNLQQTVHRRYGHPEANDIIADIFDMGSAADAYGAWHNDIREGDDAGIGCESEYQGGSLSFWKDRYYVSVVAIHESEVAARAVRSIGASVAGAIPGDASAPDLVGLLPQKNLLTEQIYFFHDHDGLTRRYRLGDGNPLLLTRSTEGLLARYRPSPTTVLLLVRYPSADEARTAHHNFRAAHTPGWKNQAAVKIVGGGWTSSSRLDDVIAVALGASDRNEAGQLIEAVRTLATDSGGAP